MIILSDLPIARPSLHRCHHMCATSLLCDHRSVPSGRQPAPGQKQHLSGQDLAGSQATSTLPLSRRAQTAMAVLSGSVWGCRTSAGGAPALQDSRLPCALSGPHAGSERMQLHSPCLPNGQGQRHSPFGGDCPHPSKGSWLLSWRGGCILDERSYHPNAGHRQQRSHLLECDMEIRLRLVRYRTTKLRSPACGMQTGPRQTSHKQSAISLGTCSGADRRNCQFSEQNFLAGADVEDPDGEFTALEFKTDQLITSHARAEFGTEVARLKTEHGAVAIEFVRLLGVLDLGIINGDGQLETGFCTTERAVAGMELEAKPLAEFDQSSVDLGTEGDHLGLADVRDLGHSNSPFGGQLLAAHNLFKTNSAEKKSEKTLCMDLFSGEGKNEPLTAGSAL